MFRLFLETKTIDIHCCIVTFTLGLMMCIFHDFLTALKRFHNLARATLALTLFVYRPWRHSRTDLRDQVPDLRDQVHYSNFNKF